MSKHYNFTKFCYSCNCNKSNTNQNVIIQQPLITTICVNRFHQSRTGRLSSWYRSCLVCSRLAYEIYSGGGPTTYVYCVVCYRVIVAPYVTSVGHVFAYLYTLDDDSKRPMDYETSLLPKVFPSPFKKILPRKHCCLHFSSSKKWLPYCLGH